MEAGNHGRQFITSKKETGVHKRETTPDTRIRILQLLLDAIRVAFKVVTDERPQLCGVGSGLWRYGGLAPTESDD